MKNTTVLVRLVEDLPKNVNYRLFFDKWFCTLDLCVVHSRMSILPTATIRKHTLKSCDLPSEN